MKISTNGSNWSSKIICRKLICFQNQFPGSLHPNLQHFSASVSWELFQQVVQFSAFSKKILKRSRLTRHARRSPQKPLAATFLWDDIMPTEIYRYKKTLLEWIKKTLCSYFQLICVNACIINMLMLWPPYKKKKRNKIVSASYNV